MTTPTLLNDYMRDPSSALLSQCRGFPIKTTLFLLELVSSQAVPQHVAISEQLEVKCPAVMVKEDNPIKDKIKPFVKERGRKGRDSLVR